MNVDVTGPRLGYTGQSRASTATKDSTASDTVLYRHRLASGENLRVNASSTGDVSVLVNGRKAVFSGIPKQMLMTASVIQRAGQLLRASRLSVHQHFGYVQVEFRLPNSGLKGGAPPIGDLQSLADDSREKQFAEYPSYRDDISKSSRVPRVQETYYPEGPFRRPYVFGRPGPVVVGDYSRFYDFPGAWQSGRDVISWGLDALNVPALLRDGEALDMADGLVDAGGMVAGAALGGAVIAGVAVPAGTAIVALSACAGIKGVVSMAKYFGPGIADVVQRQAYQYELDGLARSVTRVMNQSIQLNNGRLTAVQKAELRGYVEQLKGLGARVNLRSLRQNNAAGVKQILNDLKQDIPRILASCNLSSDQRDDIHFKENEAKLRAFSAGTTFFTKMYSFYEPEDALIVNNVFQNVAKIGQHISELTCYGRKMSYADMATHGFSIGTIVMTIAQLIFSNQRQIDSMILEISQATFKAVREMQQQMHERFNRLEGIMHHQHMMVMRTLLATQMDVRNLRNIVLNATHKEMMYFARLAEKIDQKFGALVNRILQQYEQVALGIASGNRTTLDRYIDLVSQMNALGSSSSGVGNALITGQHRVALCDTREVLEVLSSENDPRMVIGYLVQFAQHKGVLGPIDWVINPVAWMCMADAYMQLRMAKRAEFEMGAIRLHPVITLRQFDLGIPKAGSEFDALIRQLQSSDIFEILLETYERSLRVLSQISLDGWAKHLSGERVQVRIDELLDELEATMRLWQHFVKLSFPYSFLNDRVFSILTMPKETMNLEYRLASKEMIMRQIRFILQDKNERHLNRFWTLLTQAVPIQKAVIQQKQALLNDPANPQEDCHVDVRMMRQKILIFKREFYGGGRLQDIVPANYVSDVNLERLLPEDVFFHAYMGHQDGVVRLLDRGGYDINTKDDLGRTVAHVAFESGKGVLGLAIVSRDGFDKYQLDANGNSLLHAAAIGRDYDAIKGLVAMGLNTQQRNHMGKRPVDLVPDTDSLLRDLIPVSGLRVSDVEGRPLIKHDEIATGLGHTGYPLVAGESGIAYYHHVDHRTFKLTLVNGFSLESVGGGEDGAITFTRPEGVRANLNTVSFLKGAVYDGANFACLEDIQEGTLVHYRSARTQAPESFLIRREKHAQYWRYTDLQIGLWRDDKLIVSACMGNKNNELLLLDMQTKRLEKICELGSSSQVQAIDTVGDRAFVRFWYHGDGSKLNGGLFVTVDLSRKSVVSSFNIPSGGVSRPVIDFEKNRLYGYSENGIAMINPDTGAILHEWEFPRSVAGTRGVRVVFHVNQCEQKLFTYTPKGELSIWDLSSPTPTETPLSTVRPPCAKPDHDLCSGILFIADGHLLYNSHGHNMTGGVFQNVFHSQTGTPHETLSTQIREFATKFPNKTVHVIGTQAGKLLLRGEENCTIPNLAIRQHLIQPWSFA